MQIVDDESKIIVDVLVCTGPGTAETMTEDASNTIGWWERARKLSDGYSGSNVYKEDMVAHPKVNWRYMAYQTGAHADGVSMLEFGGDKTWPLQVQGRKDAQALIAAGENTHVELFTNWYDSKELKEEFPTFSSLLETLQ